MIEYKTGDILVEEAEALVNTVNCVGVMGRGIALQFKRAFPDNFKAYAAQCKRKAMQPGHVFVFETGRLTFPRYIINFPTKRDWRGKSRTEDIESGLVSLVKEIRIRGIRSVAVPPLGSGLGGLEWSEVRERMLAAMEELDGVKVVIFEPGGGAVDKRPNRSRNVPEMTAGRAALVGLMDRYLQGLLDPFVTLLEVHKLMYFMQVAGEPLNLKFVKGPYGPYSENLRHVLNAIEGHLVSGYADGGDDPGKELVLVPGALEDSREFLGKASETQARFDRVADLVEGFESSFGLELLSTVHWIVDKENARTFDDVKRLTYDWNERKKQFSLRQLGIAVEMLSQKGWIEEPGSTERGCQMSNSRHVSKLSRNELRQLQERLHGSQRGKCYICEEAIDLDLHDGNIEIDHIVPLASSGDDSLNNFALTHSECNRKKGASHLKIAQLLAVLERLQRAAKEHGRRGADLRDILQKYGGASADLRLQCSADQVQFSFPECGDSSIRSAPLYQDGLSSSKYFFALVPLEYIHHDDSINPRTIGASIKGLIEEFLNKRPQLHIGLAWWEPDENVSGKLKLFDGQHKAAAQIMLGVKRVPVRVFVKPDKEILITANTNAGSTLRQVAFSKDVMRHLGNTLYRDRVRKYKELKQLSDDEPISELNLVNHFRSESRQMSRYIIDAQRDAITQSEDNRLLEFIEWSGKKGDRPMAYSAIDGSFFQLLHMKPLTSPIADGWEDGTNPRQIERTQMVKLMTLFAEVFFVEQWNPDIGGRQIESRVSKGDLTITDEHLRAWRVSREEVAVNIVRWVRTVIENYNATNGLTIERDQLLLHQLSEPAWINISSFLKNLAALPCWTNRQLSGSVFGPKQNNGYWEQVFREGRGTDGTVILQVGLNLTKMIGGAL